MYVCIRILPSCITFALASQPPSVGIQLPGPLTLLFCLPASGLLNSFPPQGQSPSALSGPVLASLHGTHVLAIRTCKNSFSYRLERGLLAISTCKNSFSYQLERGLLAIRNTHMQEFVLIPAGTRTCLRMRRSVTDISREPSVQS